MVPIIINSCLTCLTFYFKYSLSSYEEVIIIPSLQMVKQRLKEIFKQVPLSLPHLFSILPFFSFLSQRLVGDEVKRSPILSAYSPHTLLEDKPPPTHILYLQGFRAILLWHSSL